MALGVTHPWGCSGISRVPQGSLSLLHAGLFMSLVFSGDGARAAWQECPGAGVGHKGGPYPAWLAYHVDGVVGEGVGM